MSRSETAELPSATVNMTPLIDVLLVMLVLLILTVPVTTHKTALDVPHGKAQQTHRTISLQIDYDGSVIWNDQLVEGKTALQNLLIDTANAAAEPILLVTPNRRTAYNNVAPVLAQAQRAGITRMSLTPVAD